MRYHNAADERNVKERAKKEDLKRKQELADLRELLRLPAGRRFLWDLMSYCRVFSLSFDATSGSKTYFNEGHRNVGNKIMADIQDAEPEALVKMMLESKLKEEQDE